MTSEISKQVCSVCKDIVKFTETPVGLIGEHSCIYVDWWGRDDNGSLGIEYEYRDEHPDWDTEDEHA